MGEGVTPERDNLPIEAVFGDVVVSSAHNYGAEAVVFREYGNGNVEVIGLYQVEDRTFYVPCTYRGKDIDSVVGHKSFEEVVEILALAHTRLRDNPGDGPPSEDKLRLAREILARHGVSE